MDRERQPSLSHVAGDVSNIDKSLGSGIEVMYIVFR